MKQTSFQREMEKIHWSGERRAEIEKKLRAPAESEDEDADGGYAVFPEKAPHRGAIAWAVPAACAVALAVGGVSMSVAFSRSRERTQGSSLPIEEVLPDSGSLILSGQSDAPQSRGLSGPRGFAKSGETWFFVERLSSDESLLCRGAGDGAKPEPLCEKAGCPHTAESGCPAYFSDYTVSAPAVLDGYVYLLAVRRDDRRYALLRVSPESGESEEIYTWSDTALSAQTVPEAPLAHKGILWCAVPDMAWGQSKLRWKIHGFDPVTENCVEIAGGEALYDGELSIARDLRGAGDYLYYWQDGAEMEGINSAGVCRVNLLTGQNEQVLYRATDDPELSDDWILCGGTIVYGDNLRREDEDTAPQGQCRAADLENANALNLPREWNVELLSQSVLTDNALIAYREGSLLVFAREKDGYAYRGEVLVGGAFRGGEECLLNLFARDGMIYLATVSANGRAVLSDAPYELSLSGSGEARQEDGCALFSLPESELLRGNSVGASTEFSP